MEAAYYLLTAILDPLVAAALIPLAWWVVFNGLDDLFVDVVHAVATIRSRTCPDEAPVVPEKRIAILVPCWQEHAVIGRMVQQNVEALTYERYDIFIGTYLNDPSTIEVARKLESLYAHVHCASGDKEGPTSKADCLNWTWQAVLRYEAQRGVRFDIVVIHDAEDVIHPQSFRWFSHYADQYAMIQIPVLPLATSLRHWTHGVYCDEFSEYQTRDMPAREAMGAFVPSSGVGTGFRRDIVDSLVQELGHFFEPSCLTEDYENGYRLRLAGYHQHFVSLAGPDVIATREFFPLSFPNAVRQRTRWVTGICLQTWERHGWHGTVAMKYWLWRDRKGILNNACGLISNLLCLYGLSTACASILLEVRWTTGAFLSQDVYLFTLTALISGYRILYRAVCAARFYGWAFATAAPVRMIYGNVINTVATTLALREFLKFKWSGRPIRWLKTSHDYPAQVSFGQNRRRIGELLVENGSITLDQLRIALETKPDYRRLGEHLADLGMVDELAIYEALAAQHGMTCRQLHASEIPVAVARSLPAVVARQHRLLPFRVEFASLFLACSDIPTSELRSGLKRYTNLDLRFHLVTPSNLDQLILQLL